MRFDEQQDRSYERPADHTHGEHAAMTTEAMPKVHVKDGTRFYWPDGRVCYEVPSADGKKQIKPDIRHAKKLGLLPSVTSIIKLRANHQLSLWKQEQILYAALTLQRLAGETDEHFVYRIMEDSDKQASQAADRGKIVHAGVQDLFEGRSCQDGAARAIHEAIVTEVRKRGVGWRATCEYSFARPDLGFAGTADLQIAFDDGVAWVLDLKSTDLAKFAKPYPEWKMQLAAYRWALDLPEAQLFQVVADRTTGETKIIQHEDNFRFQTAFAHLMYCEFALTGYDPRTATR